MSASIAQAVRVMARAAAPLSAGLVMAASAWGMAMAAVAAATMAAAATKSLTLLGFRCQEGISQTSVLGDRVLTPADEDQRGQFRAASCGS
ncbi:hypothetical protein QRX60_44895 [Amycolatopsis mongoliensis]|uniref:Uncharacterized protein n=1 Tax=Amycolatopsis mongoliensis TaxID=715475 RepID=A0A9Y2JM81_9PSEU|nr:hypothetical protein [Amycolatopsis sp. 4-36]WIY01100.1 hypothetical protein QRX60_44895 [Amycolatopsis sp. 4-36]